MDAQKSSWIISQRWSHLLFINYEIDPSLIQQRLPQGFKVDTFAGKAYLSIVPFYMSQVRFPHTPPLPFSQLCELNIRTYVTVNGLPGIYFFTLDTDHLLAAFIAQTFFALPYRHRPLKMAPENPYTFQSEHFNCQAKILGDREKSDFDQWIVERYSLFTHKGERIYRGIAQHEPWQLMDLKWETLQQDFLESFGFHNYRYHSAAAAKPLDVRFRPFKRLKVVT